MTFFKKGWDWCDGESRGYFGWQEVGYACCGALFLMPDGPEKEAELRRRDELCKKTYPVIQTTTH